VKVRLVAHEAIEVLAPPQSTFSAKVGVDLVRRCRLPRLNDVAKRMTLDLLRNDMNVVRHDAPSDQSVAIAIGMQEGALNELSANRIAEDASAVSSVQQSIGVSR
jgi:hypothetical protein